MKFTKMHGIGNDYVYVDCTKKDLAHTSEIAKYVSDRHFGIGSDGMILIKSSEKADFSDGYVQCGWLPWRDVRKRNPLCGKICL